MENLDPLSILLVKKGGNGDRILFRYPYSEPQNNHEENAKKSLGRNPYTLHNITEDLSNLDMNRARLNEKNLISFSSKVLSNLFAASKLCIDQKFELKVDDVRFVGHPMTLEMNKIESTVFFPKRSDMDTQNLTMFHVVFALSTSVTYSVVKCYHDLSHQLGVGIRYEDRRSGYLEKEAKIMSDAQDEVTSRESLGEESSSAFALVLKKSSLAQTLKKVFDDVSQTGYVDVRINHWSEISFCLPQKIHKKINPNLLVEPESIDKCMEQLRPYHALLLLHSERELIDSLPVDHNTAVKKVILQASPLKSFQVLAADTNLSKLFVFQIGMQLLYWGKATVIYPLCNTNVYVVSPHVPNYLSPVLLEKFADSFPGLVLAEYLQLFSLPNSVTQALPTVSRKDEYQILAEVIVWCLQHHLLIQLHTYITLALTEDCNTTFPDPLEDSLDNRPPKQSGIEAKTRDDWPPLMSIDESGYLRKRNQRINWGKGQSKEELLATFTPEERKSLVSKVPAASNYEDLKLFVTLAPYFNGTYHLEEIMYHENIRRSQLLQLIDKFRDVIIRHEHEDTNVTMYFNSSIKS